MTQEIPKQTMEILENIVISNEPNYKNVKEIRLSLLRPSSPNVKKPSFCVSVLFNTNPDQRNFFNQGNSLLECIIHSLNNLKQDPKGD